MFLTDIPKNVSLHCFPQMDCFYCSLTFQHSIWNVFLMPMHFYPPRIVSLFEINFTLFGDIYLLFCYFFACRIFGNWFIRLEPPKDHQNLVVYWDYWFDIISGFKIGGKYETINVFCQSRF